MPLAAVAAIGAVGSVAAGAMQASAAKKAAAAQERSADKSAQVQRDAITQSRIDSYPWALAGAQSLYKYMDELGIPRPSEPILPDLTKGPFAPQEPGGGRTARRSLFGGGQQQPAAAGDPQYLSPSDMEMTPSLGFSETPGYQFQVEQGEKGVLNNLSALGMRDSGAALKALTRFRQGLANQEYGTYLNRLSGVAGMGQTQTNQTNALTQNAAGNIGNAYQDAGAARASGYVGSANAWGNAIGGATNSIGNALGMRYANSYPAAPTAGLF